MDRPKYTGNELKYVKKVLKSENWSSTEGSWTNKFEKEFAKQFNAKYAIAANSGTATLHMALYALDVGPEDEVIIPAITVIMDTSVVVLCGAVPVYADVDSNSFNIDPKDVEKKITSKTKAIIAVSLYGCPCDMKELMRISNHYNIPIIEDNAQHLGKHKAHITSYSLENSKHLSCGEGGVVVTNNEEWARKMRLFGNHGFRNSQAEEGRTKLNLDVFQDPDYKRHSIFGFNFRMSEFQAAIALAQLEKIDDIIQRRKEISNKFLECFKDNQHFVVQQHNEENDWWTFAVRFAESKENWRKFRQKFISNGGHGFYGCWALGYNEPAMRNNKYYSCEPCTMAENIQPQIMQFKLNFRNDELIEQEINSLKKTLEEWK